jgi:catechol 2,3-dioxygenase-like lactoylglutathione lyase family enzyme
MSSGGSAMAVSGAMHCNLNVRSMAAAVPVYEALGLTVRMRSHAEGADSTAMGIPRGTDSDAWFLYDHRGGRASPAVELVEWTDPVTAGDTYAAPHEVGMQALGFDVPSVPDAAAAAVGAGATRREGGPDGVDAVVADVDGVAVELTAAAVPAATLRYVRVSCADLEATTRWYEQLGFAADTESAGPQSMRGPDGTTEVQERVLSLAGSSPLQLRLDRWPGTDPGDRAHLDANHRGLFRMAMGVPDARAAVDAARVAGVDASDATYIPLPGTPLGGLWVSFFRDPDGVMVEFVERPTS